jgi:hypothetical protein
MAKRVCAIYRIHENKTLVEIFGYGIDTGLAAPDEAVGFNAEILQEEDLLSPCILLDNGKKVYGCECSAWGNEEQANAFISSFKEVKNVDIDDVRNAILSDCKKRLEHF